MDCTGTCHFQKVHLERFSCSAEGLDHGDLVFFADGQIPLQRGQRRVAADALEMSQADALVIGRR